MNMNILEVIGIPDMIDVIWDYCLEQEIIMPWHVPCPWEYIGTQSASDDAGYRNGYSWSGNNPNSGRSNASSGHRSFRGGKSAGVIRSCSGQYYHSNDY